MQVEFLWGVNCFFYLYFTVSLTLLDFYFYFYIFICIYFSFYYLSLKTVESVCAVWLIDLWNDTKHMRMRISHYASLTSGR